MLRPAVSLNAIKLVHTIAWAFFVACILAIPIAAWRGRFTQVLLLAGIVFIEVGIVVANRMRCPLTGVAARYTSDRRDNFDIFLRSGSHGTTKRSSAPSSLPGCSSRLLDGRAGSVDRLDCPRNTRPQSRNRPPNEAAGCPPVNPRLAG
jgi:hypothetical protein